jgi:Xaa-Pro aminopeptidase
MNVFESAGVDGLIITGATNRRYFSGWSASDHAPDRPTGVMLVTPTQRLLYASSTNLSWAASEARPDVETRPISGLWQPVVARDALSLGLKRIGFEDAVLPVASHRELASAIGSAADLVPLGDTVDATRRVKQQHELASIRAALAITDEAFGRAATYIREGMNERALAMFIDQQFRDLGSDGNAFETIVASGPNAAKPHHTPGDREIGVGEPVIIDMGARVDGYCGDLTRTIWVGQPTEQLGTMYHLVADAQRAAFAAIKGGAEARAVDRAARDVFQAAGTEELLLHGVGHALGLRIHESPFLSQSSSDVLEHGNVITVEPGQYQAGWGGVRIEDVVLVTSDGYENLTAAPKLLGE